MKKVVIIRARRTVPQLKCEQKKGKRGAEIEGRPGKLVGRNAVRPPASVHRRQPTRNSGVGEGNLSAYLHLPTPNYFYLSTIYCFFL